MKVEKPNKKTTLVLTAAFQPVGFFSARSTMRNLIVGAVRGVDHLGNIYEWNDWIKRIDFDEDQPCLRTSTTTFAIPTIIVIPGFFGNFKDAKRKFKRTSTLRQIYNLYDGTCQYCLKPVKYSLATKDHHVPKSKGGVNYDSNIVLACKKCNNKKAARFPFNDARGASVTPKVFDDVDFMIKADNIRLRPEWEAFLIKKTK